MPQMAPYNWLILFVLFNFLMIYLLSFIYFMNMNSFKKKMLKPYYSYYSWKW